MQRAIFAAVITLTSLLFQAPASASIDGCPDTWSIDLSKFPDNPDLIQAKQKLGPNMVVTPVNRVILKYFGELGDMPSLSGLENVAGLSRLSYFYLYGKSEVETTQKVEVKDCPNPGVFKFKHKFSTDSFSEVQQTTAREWSKSNEIFFVDFKQQQEFETKLDGLNLASQSRVDIRRNNPNASGSSVLLPEVFPLGYSPTGIVKFPGPILTVQSLTPGCIAPSKRSSAYPEFVFGRKCQFAWSVLRRVDVNSPTSQDVALVMFEPFVIDGSSNSATIQCVKGKLTKKVTAIKPKCPAGYKKK